jgi:hypothetical protein
MILRCEWWNNGCQAVEIHISESEAMAIKATSYSRSVALSDINDDYGLNLIRLINNYLFIDRWFLGGKLYTYLLSSAAKIKENEIIFYGNINNEAKNNFLEKMKEVKINLTGEPC